MKDTLFTELGAAALILAVLAGCQTVPADRNPPRAGLVQVIKTHPPSDPGGQDDNAWRPVACILFSRDQANSPTEQRFRQLLDEACERHGIPLIEDQGPVPAGTTAFLQILRVQHEQASPEPGQDSGPYAWYSCQVECSDRRRGPELPPGAAGNLVAVSRLLELDSDIVGRSPNDDTGVLRSLANQLAAFAADEMVVRQTLLEGIRHMGAPDVTRRSSELFSLQQYDQASLYLNEVCRRFPEYQPAFCYLGACQAALGAYEQARGTLNAAIRLAPNTEEATRAQQWLEMLPASP